MFASTSFAVVSLALLAALLVVVGWDLVRRARAKIEKAKTADESKADASSEARDSDQPFAILAPVASELAQSGGAVPTRHPIVLVHGYFGFDAIGLSRLRREYFRGVKKALQALGHEVFVARVSTAAGIELRAAQLAEQIKRLPAPRVNVIAHSMGGLDARYAIARLGIADRVASLVTIGTPHRGTPVADRGARFVGEWKRVRRALDALGANVDGLYDLTTRRMEEFNRAVEDVPSVTYASIVGTVLESRRTVPMALARAHAFLEKHTGPNDGLVPADSQKWGRVLGHIDANHWAQIGWSQGFDAASFYVSVAAHLAETGH